MVTAAGGWGNYEYRLTVGTPTPAAHSVYGNYSSTSVFEGLVSETRRTDPRHRRGFCFRLS